MTQIWFVKDDQKTPAFDEISINEGINLKQPKKVLFDENCLDCDTSPFVHQFILREGVDYLAKALASNPNSNALLTIARIENISKSFRERSKLTKEILGKFRSTGI